MDTELISIVLMHTIVPMSWSVGWFLLDLSVYLFVISVATCWGLSILVMPLMGWWVDWLVGTLFIMTRETAR